MIDRFGDRALTDVKTADIEDFIADLKLPRVVNRQPNRTLSPASVNRTIELLRHMMNWAVGRTRLVPTATARLQAVLEWLQLDADGEKKPDDAFVFSDETGERLGRFRTAWVTTVLKAHGVKPQWKSYNWTALTPECQVEFRRINLRWHDLRHEYASRLVEKGVPVAQMRDLLGHASITTTERYDNQKLEKFVERKAESGLYNNASEVIREVFGFSRNTTRSA